MSGEISCRQNGNLSLSHASAAANISGQAAFCSDLPEFVIIHLLEKHSTTERLFSTAKLRQICSTTFHHYILCCGATSTTSGQKV